MVKEFYRAGKSCVEAACFAGKITSFRTLSLAALNYMEVEHENGGLSNSQKTLTEAGVNLGVIANDYFDQGLVQREAYMANREKIAELHASGQYIRYYKDLTYLERNRPNANQMSWDEAVLYRERVNAVSLGGMLSVAGMAQYEDLIDENKLIRASAPIWVKNMWNVVMALQVIDDQMGWKGDSMNNRPSFYTGLNSKNVCHKKKIKILNETWRRYLDRAENGNEGEMDPFILVVGIMGAVLPKMYEAARKLKLSKVLMKGRERHEG